MELKPGYRQTEVGVIPADWDVVPLGREVERLDSGVSVNSVDERFRTYAHEQAILKTSAIANGQFLPNEGKKIAPRDVNRARLNPRIRTSCLGTALQYSFCRRPVPHGSGRLP